MPCVVPEMLWTLDELKRTLISEFPILETEEGRFQNIVWLVCWMGWNPVKLPQPASALLNLGNCGPESFSQGISGRAYSCGIALEGCHRTPEDPIALHIHTHRSSYSTKGIVYQKNLRIQPKTCFLKKWTCRCLFFYFFLFGGKMLWNMIIWNMGEIVVFPAFWRVAHTIVSSNFDTLDLWRLWKYSVVMLVVQDGVWCFAGIWNGICDPNLIKKDVNICLRIPHAGLATHTRGASYSRGHRTLGVEIWYHLGSRKNSVIQTWPSLRIRKLNRQPNASKKYAEQLIQWSSKIPERSWWLMRETRLYVYSRNHCLRSCGLKGS